MPFKVGVKVVFAIIARFHKPTLSGDYDFFVFYYTHYDWSSVNFKKVDLMT